MLPGNYVNHALETLDSLKLQNYNLMYGYTTSVSY